MNSVLTCACWRFWPEGSRRRLLPLPERPSRHIEPPGFKWLRGFEIYPPFTARLTVGRAVGGLALLAASILLMWTQTTNPFLYFQF